MDLILFCASFEGAGNYDGKGPINAVVDEAVAAGIIWINSAGNYGGRVYNGPVTVSTDGWVRLGQGDGMLRFRNLFDENTITVTLTWNDYRSQEDAGTDKDLDLYVTDDQRHILASSTLTQISGTRQTGPGETRNPRERVVLTDLPAAPNRDYLIYVKARSEKFTASDRLRVLLTASRDVPFRDPRTGVLTQPVQFLDASESGEVFPPADHPRAIAVGESSRFSAIGPTADGRSKPDVIVDYSTARFSNGEETTGASNAAACFAGVVAVLKAAQPALTTSHLQALARRIDPPSETRPAARVSASPPLPPVVGVTGSRALRYAQLRQQELQARGAPPGGVWITLRDGRQVAVRVSVPAGSRSTTSNYRPAQGVETVPMPVPVNPSAARSAPGQSAQVETVPMPVPVNPNVARSAPRQPAQVETVPMPVLADSIQTGSAIKRPPPPRTPWRTPSPQVLADYVRLYP